MSGATAVCTTSTGGTATVTDAGGGILTHQWGYRTTSGGFVAYIAGQKSGTCLIRGPDFAMGPGLYYLVCLTFPECGTLLVSNEIPPSVTADQTQPVVTSPPALTTAQTLCM